MAVSAAVRTGTAAAAPPLIAATGLSLRVPVVRPDDRTLLANPARFLIDLYLGRATRGIATLLEEVTFTLEPGMRLGLLGPNGAGKSTLLRLLMGIYAPSSGALTVRGRVQGLFDIGLGMNHEATGLENIYLRGLEMGLSLAEIRAGVGPVAAFSELGEGLEKPFSVYSTGMRLRLAMAILQLADPDILLLDEWVGTGDAGFQTKITEHVMDRSAQGRGLILASHTVPLMRRLCTHGLVLEHGRTTFFGPIDPALEAYQAVKARTAVQSGQTG